MSQVALLADDERDLRAYASEVLRREGFTVIEAADGDDALEIIQSLRGGVSVVVTDIHMPRMNGIELVRAIRAEFPGMPVVYISGESLDGLRDGNSRVACLPKPFGPRALLDAVRSVIMPAGQPAVSRCVADGSCESQ